MLGTRLWVGSLLIVLTVGMLIGDQYLWPWYPFLLLFVVGLGLAGCAELFALLGPGRAPQKCPLVIGIILLACATWIPHQLEPPRGSWPWIAGSLAGLHLAAFLCEMARYTGPGRGVERMAVTLWIVGYLGLLPSFLAQVRWLFPPETGTIALSLAIFVPKACDIGAYATGRLLGRHPMTPVLSPKKTWEGAAGGLVLACIVAVVLDRIGPPVLGTWWAEIGFGLTLGMAGMLGDLAESLIKRDCERKDASQTVPGFGGILDVVDAVLFAGPVAYMWFVFMR